MYKRQSHFYIERTNNSISRLLLRMTLCRHDNNLAKRKIVRDKKLTRIRRENSSGTNVPFVILLKVLLRTKKVLIDCTLLAKAFISRASCSTSHFYFIAYVTHDEVPRSRKICFEIAAKFNSEFFIDRFHLHPKSACMLCFAWRRSTIIQKLIEILLWNFAAFAIFETEL